MKIFRQIASFACFFIVANSLSAQTRIDTNTNNLIVSAQKEIFFEDDGQIKSYDTNHIILFRRSQNIMELKEFGNIVLKPLTGKVRIEGSYNNGNIGGSLVLHHPGKTSGAAQDWVMYNMSGVYGNSLQFWAYDNVPCSSGGLCNSRFTIMDNGNVGIGTNDPTAKLHISAGNLKLDADQAIIFADNGQIRSRDENHRIIFRRDENKMELREFGSIIFSPGASGGLETSKVVMLENGSVGIGTNSTGSFKLAVEGRIAARGLKVTNTNFADYVFEPTYQLRSISNLKNYINENKHLPGIPSAREVEKEGGFELAEMNVKLLEKVEELTLYIIEQDKRIQALEKKNERRNKKRQE